MNQPIDTDIIIIGGGLSGLAAALKIKDANDAATGQDTKYLVLESHAKRLGGRVWARAEDKDFGGGYVGSSQNHILYLIRRFQVPTLATFLDPRTSWLYQDGTGRPIKFPGDHALDFPGGTNALTNLMKIDTMVLDVRRNLLDPANSPLSVYDAMSVQDYIDRERAAWRGESTPDIGMSATTAEVFAVSVRCAFSLEPREVSFFFLLYYAATAGSYSTLVDVEGGTGAAEGTRFAFGTSDLLAKVSAEIGENNIMFGASVATLEYGEDGVTATTVNGQVYTAKRAVVAMSPPISANITYVPSFTDAKASQAARDRHQLCLEMRRALGQTIKGFVNLSRPAWRKKGLMGFALSAAPFREYPLNWTLDNCWAPPGEAEPTKFSLMTFIAGEAAAYWSTRDERSRAEAVIKQVTEIYSLRPEDFLNPHDLASNYEEENWPLQVALGLGAPDAMMGKGTLTSYGHALRAPVGPIHFAGAEAATEWAGYMNGAIESGFRAATEALVELEKAGGAAAVAEGDEAA